MDNIVLNLQILIFLKKGKICIIMQYLSLKKYLFSQMLLKKKIPPFQNYLISKHYHLSTQVE